ncbi:hypothetical protein NDU88_007167 [Pleurodeles waltl]|uniref:Uncharacterized protein n=1 Tax=Pleurodeles waltl TaxID=8319 RepID=A0AAV7UN32_PLEWA|nr:hypothetical protein NDU88_007167 [Pleurodeles waltl]
MPRSAAESEEGLKTQGMRDTPNLWVRAAAGIQHSREAASRVSSWGGRKTNFGCGSTRGVSNKGAIGPLEDPEWMQQRQGNVLSPSLSVESFETVFEGKSRAMFTHKGLRGSKRDGLTYSLRRSRKKIGAKGNLGSGVPGLSNDSPKVLRDQARPSSRGGKGKDKSSVITGSALDGSLRITPKLRNFFRIKHPGMEKSDCMQQTVQSAHVEKGALEVGMYEGDRQVSHAVRSSNRFQPLESIASEEMVSSGLPRGLSLDRERFSGEVHILETEKVVKDLRPEGDSEEMRQRRSAPESFPLGAC